jgi:hypothetical protein
MPEFHMHQLSFKWTPQQKLLKMTKDFHGSLVQTIIQVLQQWIQMPRSGKELLSMMVRFMEKRNIKKMLTTYKLMVLNKKMLPMPEFHMHQLSFKWTPQQK